MLCIKHPLEELWAHRPSLRAREHVLHLVLKHSAILAILAHLSLEQAEKNERLVGMDYLVGSARYAWIKQELDV